MQPIVKVIGIILLLGIVLHKTSAQEGVNTAGADGAGAGGAISFSVGQPFYSPSTSSEGSVSAGIQQAYIVRNVLAINEKYAIRLHVYPNPASDHLLLEVENTDLSGIYYYLYDLQGQLIQHHRVIHNQMKINVSGLLNGLYLMKILQEDQELQSFKIIKQ